MSKSRFVLIGRTGKRIVSADKGYVALLDPKLDLMWAAEDASKDSLPHAAAMEAASAVRLLKFKDWRGPEQLELESLRDLSRHSPAADPLLNMKSGWYWSSTSAAWSREVAWYVYFYLGEAYCSRRSYHARVRAVRVASQ